MLVIPHKYVIHNYIGWTVCITILENVFLMGMGVMFGGKCYCSLIVTVEGQQSCHCLGERPNVLLLCLGKANCPVTVSGEC